MAALYWVIAILMGVPIGVGIAFMVFSALLNKSNNMGDSRSELKDFSSQIVYLSQESNMKHNIQLFVSYTDMNYEALTKSRDYLERARTRIQGNGALVTRYFPGSEENENVDGSYDENVNPGVSEGLKTTAVPLAFAGALFGRKPQAPVESAWAAARRKNLGATASENPWGRDESWGAKAPSSGTVESPKMDLDMTMDTGAQKKAPTQSEIDAFWSGGKKAASAEAPAAAAETAAVEPSAATSEPAMAADPFAASADSVAAGSAAAPLGAAPGGADAFASASTTTDPFAVPAPAPAEEPVYDAPTATRPLWLSGDPNDDFSDFDDV